MDLPRSFTIRESSHRIHNPFTSEKLARREYQGWGVFALMNR